MSDDNLSEIIKTGVQSKGKVLVVDDSAFIQSQMQRILTSEGYEIAGFASDGQSAVDFYQKEWKNIDVVTLDITMPRMDGISTLDAIMKINKDAKVVMVTAVGKAELVKKALLMGAKGYIIKPIKQAMVLDKIATAME